MANMTNYLDDISSHVREKMNAFAQRVSASVPSIICNVDWYPTDAYFLRSFVSLRTDDDGDELALTVNITRLAPDNTVSIESGICMEDGTVVASGPSTTLRHVRNLAAWMNQFDEFLQESEPHVIKLLKGTVEPDDKVVRAPGIG
jgi:hypothetical protein